MTIGTPRPLGEGVRRLEQPVRVQAHPGQGDRAPGAAGALERVGRDLPLDARQASSVEVTSGSMSGSARTSKIRWPGMPRMPTCSIALAVRARSRDEPVSQNVVVPLRTISIAERSVPA